MEDSVSITTAVPSPTFSTEGITVPDLSDVLAGTQTDISTALGDDASTSLSTPQGQIAMSRAAVVGSKDSALLAFANNINPDYSSGRFQDGIGQIYFISRKAATGTTVTAVCTGAVGTVIPAGSYAQDTSGYIYASSSSATLDSAGQATVTFVNLTTGPIECAAGALSTVYQSVSGWSGISNAASGVTGSDEESRNAFEARRRAMVANGGNGSVLSLYSTLIGVDGVTDVYVRSNNTTTALSVGSTSVTIPTGTCYIAVYGGSDSDIGAAIHSKLQPCCATMGSESYTYTDTENYNSNYPEYTYNWTVPNAVDIYLKVEIENNDYLSSSINSDIQSAIVSAFNGDDGNSKARIGDTIYASRYYGPTQDVDTKNLNIVSITISRDGSTFGASVELGIDEIPVISSSNITVTKDD